MELEPLVSFTRFVFAVAVLILCFAGTANAGPMEDARAAYKTKDYPTAIKVWRMLAEQGYVEAQYQTGRMYEIGQGTLQDYQAAASWYRKAANLGHADAQNKLGLMYYKGWGVLQDYTQAHVWFNISATKGSVKARKNRDDITQKMSSGQINDAQNLARQWITNTTDSKRTNTLASKAPDKSNMANELAGSWLAIIRTGIGGLECPTRLEIPVTFLAQENRGSHAQAKFAGSNDIGQSLYGVLKVDNTFDGAFWINAGLA